MIHRPSHCALALLLAFTTFTPAVQAATVNWAGHTWNVTTGGMAGNNTGSAANVTVDGNGYLHLKISQTNGTWLCAELFTSDTIGFGTYQWQIDAPVDKLDKNVVLGLYPYGPIAGTGADGTNEIDIEYARWGNAAWANGNFTVYPNSGNTVGETTFDFSLSGTYTTSTFVWSGSAIRFRAQEGFKSVGDSSGTLKSWTYAPANPTTNIPQRAVPLGMNLWLCDGCGGAPSDGKPVEVIIRSFVHLAPGTTSVREQALGAKATEVRISAGHPTVEVHLDSPLPNDRTFAVIDLQGRVENTIFVSRGSSRFAIDDLRPGVHVLAASGAGLARTFLVPEIR